MATRNATPEAETDATRSLVDANMKFVNLLVEAGYKAQTRSLNVARVFVEGASRQQENSRRIMARLVDHSLPWNAPERYNLVMNSLVENQHETLRTSREYIDELNAAAAESRQTVETILQQATKAREAQQVLFGQGFSALRQFGNSVRDGAAEAARA